jgi:hypothetical protein
MDLADTVSVAAFDFGPDLISPTRSATRWPAPDAPLCAIVSRVSITR